MPDTVSFYLNRGQRYVYELMPRLLTYIAGRRNGKTHGVQAPYLCRLVCGMPRGKSFIYCDTFKQGLTRTIPGTISALESMTGWAHGVHFFVGCKAPKAAAFPEPITTTFNWEHCIHWFNGHVTHILSQDVKFSANSLTLDGGLIDEARNMKKRKVDQELMPAISGTPGMFMDFPLKKSIYITTDRPLSREGQWVIDRQVMATPEVERDILQLIRERAYMVKNNYPQKHIARQLRDINEKRKDCHLYCEYDTIENIAIVGEDYIADMRRALPPRVFAISILNKSLLKASDGFYASFNADIHTYDPDTANKLEDYRIVVNPKPGNRSKLSYETYDFKRLQEHTCELDTDIDPKQPLNVALDYNANINWIVTGQRGEIRDIPAMRVLSSMFVKNGDKLRELIRDWCDYYEHQRRRNNRVTFYFNQTAKQTRYANDTIGERFHVTVEKELRARGWIVTPVDMGPAVFHEIKFQMWDDAFKRVVEGGRYKYLFPLLNKGNNEYLIAAIEDTETTEKYKGFGKQKGGEKKAEDPDDGDFLELRTDGTDALDDLFIGMNKFYKSGSFYVPGITIR